MSAFAITQSPDHLIAQLTKHKPGLIVYLTCGDPNLEMTREIALAAIDAGADVIELGVPFSDPMADGPVIQRASERALANGVTLAGVLHLAGELRKERSQAGLIIFSYLNPILHFGLRKFAVAAKACGIDGALVVDLTVEESRDYLAAMRAQNLATIFLSAPTSTDARLRQITQQSRGFIYAISRTGVTGTREQLAEDAEALVKRLRRFANLPIAVGFGISTTQQFHDAGKFADAVVIGSAIVRLIEENGEKAAKAVSDFIRSLKPQSAAARR
jgi:tryptophan synthase alpha chain